MAPPPSPSSTSWHSAASSTGTTKSVSFALPPYSDSSSSDASFSSLSSASSSNPGSAVRPNSAPSKPARSRSIRLSRFSIGRRASRPEETIEQDGFVDQSRRSRLLSRRSVKRLTLAPPPSPPSLPLPELPPLVHSDGASSRSQRDRGGLDGQRSQQPLNTTRAHAIPTTPMTGLAYLAPSPIGVSSPDGFEAIGQIALQSSSPDVAHQGNTPAQAFPAYQPKSELSYSSRKVVSQRESFSQCPPDFSYRQRQPEALLANATGPKHPGLGPAGAAQSDAPQMLSAASAARASFYSVDKTAAKPNSHSAEESRDTFCKRDLSSATATTWSAKLRSFMKVYDKSDDSSHSLPRLHRIMEPFLLLVPLLISLYLLGSAIVPFEWWRARLSIARVGLAGQSADSDERMVDGEEIGLFGVWGWCVMNSDEV